MQNITRIENHRWEFENEQAASNLFDILMFSELGNKTDFGIFDHFDIKVIGNVFGVLQKISVKQIAINTDYKEIVILSKEDNFYSVNLDESIAQFIKKYWDTN